MNETNQNKILIPQSITEYDIDSFIKNILDNHSDYSFSDKITMTKAFLINCKYTLEELDDRMFQLTCMKY